MGNYGCYPSSDYASFGHSFAILSIYTTSSSQVVSGANLHHIVTANVNSWGPKFNAKLEEGGGGESRGYTMFRTIVNNIGYQGAPSKINNILKESGR